MCTYPKQIIPVIFQFFIAPVRKDLSKFKEYVREYQEEENEEEKENIAMLLKRELKDSSAFTAFKRWLIWDNEEKYGELEKFIPENQKKKLFDI